MPANPLGVALRNRHAGHDSLVWARPDLQAPENFTLDQPGLRSPGTHPGKAPGPDPRGEYLTRPRLDAGPGRHR